MRFFFIAATAVFALSLQAGKLLGAGVVRLLQFWADRRNSKRGK
jgi:hypothetical protein